MNTYTCLDNVDQITDRKGNVAVAVQDIELPEDSQHWVVLDAAEGRTTAGQARSPGNLRQQLEAIAQLLESPSPVRPFSPVLTSGASHHACWARLLLQCLPTGPTSADANDCWRFGCSTFFQF